MTTIDHIACAAIVRAIPANQFGRKRAKRIRSRSTKVSRNRRHRKQPQVSEETIEYTIEGIAAYDAKNNLVLLKIAESGKPIPLGDSDAVQIGEPIYTLGYRDNVEYKGTVGPLQSRYRNNTWLQIQTKFFSGFVGGPVLNSSNEVIGVAAFGHESAVDNGSTAIQMVISSNMVEQMLGNSATVMSLVQFQKHSRVRAYALEFIAEELRYQNKNQQAIANYNAALKLNPDLPEAYFKRALAKNYIADFQGALRDFDKIIRINPGHPFAYSNRASTKSVLGDLHGAIDDLNKSIQLDPQYVLAYTNRAEIKMIIADIKAEAGDIAEARQSYQESIDDFNKAIALNRHYRLARKHVDRAKRALALLNYKAE